MSMTLNAKWIREGWGGNPTCWPETIGSPMPIWRNITSAAVLAALEELGDHYALRHWLATAAGCGPWDLELDRVLAHQVRAGRVVLLEDGFVISPPAKAEQWGNLKNTAVSVFGDEELSYEEVARRLPAVPRLDLDAALSVLCYSVLDGRLNAATPGGPAAWWAMRFSRVTA